MGPGIIIMLLGIGKAKDKLFPSKDARRKMSTGARLVTEQITAGPGNQQPFKSSFQMNSSPWR